MRVTSSRGHPLLAKHLKNLAQSDDVSAMISGPLLRLVISKSTKLELYKYNLIYLRIIKSIEY